MRQPVSYIDAVARQGDTFDILSFRYYHEEHLAHHILQANPDMIDILIFAGGEHVKIPRLSTAALPSTLPPWRRK